MENNFMEQALVMPKKYDTVTGVVVSVRQDTLVIDLNTFTEGELSLDDYSYDRKITSFIGVVSVGDEVTCVITEMNKNSDETSITLSRLPILKEENQSIINKLYETKTPIDVKIEKAVNRGFIARYSGVEIFIPEGQVDIKLDPNKNYVNQNVTLLLIDKKEKSFVGSVKTLLFDVFNEKKEKEYDALRVGEDVEGTVYKIESFGALIKFDNVIGLLRISQISHERINKVEDVLKVGEKITVKILKKENGKVDLSRRALLETPHKLYAAKHKISDVISGKVIQKLPIGLIVELEKNITALLHKNEFSWNPNDNSMASVKVGDTVEAAIITLDVLKERIGLSKKVLIDNPWGRITAKVGDLTDVKISEIVGDKGVLVNAYGVDGFISKNDLVLGEKQSKIEDVYQVGDEMKAVVIDFNPRSWNLKLSAKKHADKLERIQFEEYMEEQKETEEKISLGDVFKDVLK